MLSLSSILLLTASAALAVPNHELRSFKRHQDLVKRKTYSANQVTWYPTDTGPDACTGKNHKDSDAYVALNVADWNNGKNCGRKVLITSNGVTKPGTIVDKCATCYNSGEIDLTRDLFTSFGYPLSKGVFTATWVYADEQQEQPEAPKPTTNKKPEPTTKKPEPTTQKPEPTTKKPEPTTKKPDTPNPTPAPEQGDDKPISNVGQKPPKEEEEEDDEDCEYYEDDEEEEAAKPPVKQPEPPKAAPPKADPPKAAPPKADPPKATPPKADPPKADPPKADPPKADPPKSIPTSSSAAPAISVAAPAAPAALVPSDPAPAVVNPAAAPTESVGTESIQGGIAGDSTFGNGAVSISYSKAVPALVTLVFLAVQGL